MLLHTKTVGLIARCAFLLAVIMAVAPAALAGDNAFTIEEAKWDAEKARLLVKGKGRAGRRVALKDAATATVLGSVVVDKEEWSIVVRGPDPVPCRVRAEEQGGRVAEHPVKKAGRRCRAKTGGKLSLTAARWLGNKNKLEVKGRANRRTKVTVRNADTGVVIASVKANKKGRWRVRKKFGDAANAPCRVEAKQAGGGTARRDVRDAPAACDDGGTGDGGGGSGGNGGGAPKNEFNILMNYELGMHCTGFEFSYCCVLPPYNSILAQVVKTEKSGKYPRLLEADPAVGLDALGRPTVVRDPALDKNGNFKKYVLKYWHEAQPRNDGRGAPQSDRLISRVEGNSLLMWNTVFDRAVTNPDGSLKTGSYNGADGVLLGDGPAGSDTDHDNYANAWMNHLYFFDDLEGGNSSGTSLEADKIRLGIHVSYPDNTGPALHPMGPGVTGAGFDNLLTFSGDKGTVVYTQMKVLENLPVMLTSPRLWEALGLPLTPFEDTIKFYADPGLIDESSVRPYVAMKAALHRYDPNAPGGVGDAVLDDGQPVTGFGTAPIDIPNCERCHALGKNASENSAQNDVTDPDGAISQMVAQELDFWNTYYDIDVAAGDSDWYSRLKAAAISMLALHDKQHGTEFTANFAGADSRPGFPQNTRLGHETVLCQRCHADNVIAAVKSATKDNALIPPLTEAIHLNHKDLSFDDSLGRNGGCQGCHPAHRSDGSMESYPITELGLNAFAAGDNRDAAGGCFVGRDVHSNRNRNSDGCETPSHLNGIGRWLVDNVASDSGTDKGIWCTNCHTQLSQELWKAENVADLVHARPGDPGHVREPSANATLTDIAAGIGVDINQAIAWLDPKTNDDMAAVWHSDPGLCDFLAGGSPAQDGTVATIEVALPGQSCSTGFGVAGPDCDNQGGSDFEICGSSDDDGDFSVNLLDFCTTPDCVAAAQTTLANSSAVAVPFSAATDGRDHWLAPGEPHCADCHAAPYVEQSGNINAFPPFNYPRKASLFRYSRGHQDIGCQGCHESIHGLYPVTPDIDTTTYAQAASLNADGSHGPLKCQACHETNSHGVVRWADRVSYEGQPIAQDFDRAVSWAHAYTDETNPLEAVCRNCHEDESDEVSWREEEWLEHADKGRISRNAMDKAERIAQGHLSGDPAVQDPLATVCQSCHGDKRGKVSCTSTEWKKHLTRGRVAQPVWEHVSTERTGSTCGW